MEHATTVLIADGAEEFCSSLTAALQRAGGFQIVGTATDGEQAIRSVQQLKPDILVLDLMLSKLDGIPVLLSMGKEHLYVWEMTWEPGGSVSDAEAL